MDIYTKIMLINVIVYVAAYNFTCGFTKEQKSIMNIEVWLGHLKTITVTNFVCWLIYCVITY